MQQLPDSQGRGHGNGKGKWSLVCQGEGSTVGIMGGVFYFYCWKSNDFSLAWLWEQLEHTLYSIIDSPLPGQCMKYHISTHLVDPPTSPICISTPQELKYSQTTKNSLVHVPCHLFCNGALEGGYCFWEGTINGGCFMGRQKIPCFSVVSFLVHTSSSHGKNQACCFSSWTPWITGHLWKFWPYLSIDYGKQLS